jgi:hypothetical protein
LRDLLHGLDLRAHDFLSMDMIGNRSRTCLQRLRKKGDRDLGGARMRAMIIGLVSVVGGVMGSGLSRPWLMLMQDHLMVMRALKGIEDLALGGDGS